MHIETIKLSAVFCGELVQVRCRRFDDRVTIVYKDCDSFPYYLRVYRDGVFRYDFPCNTAWEAAVQELLDRCFFNAVKRFA